MVWRSRAILLPEPGLITNSLEICDRCRLKGIHHRGTARRSRKQILRDPCGGSYSVVLLRTFGAEPMRITESTNLNPLTTMYMQNSYTNWASAKKSRPPSFTLLRMQQNLPPARRCWSTDGPLLKRVITNCEKNSPCPRI